MLLYIVRSAVSQILSTTSLIRDLKMVSVKAVSSAALD